MDTGRRWVRLLLVVVVVVAAMATQATAQKGSIEIAGERYLLIRASALSYGFLSAIRKLYAERGDAEGIELIEDAVDRKRGWAEVHGRELTMWALG